jgi:hypothetical protein
MIDRKKIWLTLLALLALALVAGCSGVVGEIPSGTPGAESLGDATAVATLTPLGPDGEGGGDSDDEDDEKESIELTLAVVEQTLTAIANSTSVVVTEEVLKEVTREVEVEVLVTPTKKPPKPTSTPTPTSDEYVIEENVLLTDLANTLTAIVVSSTPTQVTPSPTLRPGDLTATAANKPPDTPTPTPIPCNVMRFAYDDTYPDGSRVDPGEVFVKRWRVQNTGICTWEAWKYSLVFYYGERLNGTTPLVLQFSIAPQEYTTLSVVLTAPYIPGNYKGYWMLQDNEGNLFGWGPKADQPVYVDIWVRGEVPTVPVVDFATITPSP